MNDITIKISTTSIPDEFPKIYVGCVTLPSGSVLSTGRPRGSRTSARRDATRLARSLADDPDYPLDL
jgi:hypothetical protein